MSWAIVVRVFSLSRSIGESPSVHPFCVLPCGGGVLVVVFHMQAGRLPPPPPAPTLAVLHLPSFLLPSPSITAEEEEGRKGNTRRRDATFSDSQNRFWSNAAGIPIHLLQRTILTYLLRTRVIGAEETHSAFQRQGEEGPLLLLLSDDKPLTLAAGHSPPPSTFLLLLDMLSFIGVSLTSSLSPFPYPKNLQRHKNLRGELFFGRCEHISPNVWRFPFQEPRKTFFPHSNSLNCFFSLLSSDTSPPF